MIEIIPNLFQGDRNDAIRCSRDGSVGLIVYLGQEMNEQKLMYGSKVPIIHIPLNDGHNPELKLEYVLVNITYGIVSDKVLLACRLGVSRSPALTILYLTLDKSFDDAYNYVKKKIPQMQIEPHLYKVIEELGTSAEKKGRT